jgi:hypothetical protein
VCYGAEDYGEISGYCARGEGRRLGWHDGGGVDGSGGLGTLAAVVQGRMRLFWEGTVDRRGRGEKDPVCLDLVGVTAREWPDGVCGGDWVRCRVLRMWKDGGVGLRADR